MSSEKPYKGFSLLGKPPAAGEKHAFPDLLAVVLGGCWLLLGKSVAKSVQHQKPHDCFGCCSLCSNSLFLLSLLVDYLTSSSKGW